MALRAAGSHDCCPLYVGQRALSAAWPHTPVLPASSALEGAEPASPAPLPCCLQLRAALQEPDGSVPGFMKVCDCLVSTSSTGKEAGFSGMIIGELHGEWSAGWTVLVRPCALCAMEGRQRARWRAVRHGLGVWARDSCLPSHPLTLPPTLSSSAPPTYPPTHPPTPAAPHHAQGGRCTSASTPRSSTTSTTSGRCCSRCGGGSGLGAGAGEG